MSKPPRLSRSGIDYLDYAWNPYSGCRNQPAGICGPFKCWAETITGRFKHHYPNGFEPTCYVWALESPLHFKKPSRIGVAFMGDLFGDWMFDDTPIFGFSGEGTHRLIRNIVGRCFWHTFIFLTKCPWNLPKWNPWPANCQVGVTVTNHTQLENAYLLSHVEAKVKFLSIEPLLERLGLIDIRKDFVQGVIIGAQTGPGAVKPRIAWIEEITEAADRAGAKLFYKENLLKLYPELPRRQEIP